MTGFASATRENEIATVAVSVRAVNHRFLDLQIKLPSSLAALEPGIRSLAQKTIARGRLEVAVSVTWRQLPAAEVALNEAVVEALFVALERVRERGLVGGPLSPGDLLRFPQAVVMREAAADGEQAARVAPLVDEAVGAALADLDRMRVKEGELLARDLEERRLALARAIEDVAAAAREGQASLTARLTRRLQEIEIEHGADAAAIAQEIVRFAARSDISEEVVRFRAHLEHWAALVAADEPCGRKLDFLLQEMNREINTIGSKAEGPRLSELIVATKAELERMREQVQNVE